MAKQLEQELKPTNTHFTVSEMYDFNKKDVKNGCALVQELKSGLHLHSNGTTVTMANTDGSSNVGEKDYFIVFNFEILEQTLWVRIIYVRNNMLLPTII